jgi:hypothetical protein
MMDSQTPLELSPTMEKLTQRYELFKVIQASHVRWMNKTSDPKVKEMHRAIVALFKDLLEQYKILMDAPQS